MKYASKDGACIEWLWNSRDGVTPFCIMSRDRKHEMTHVDWQFDIRIPHYVPLVGERIFVDMTYEAARSYAAALVGRSWNAPATPMNAMFGTKDEAIDHFTQSNMGGGGGQPDIVVVDAAMRDGFSEKLAGVIKEHLRGGRIDVQATGQAGKVPRSPYDEPIHKTKIDRRVFDDP